MKVETRELEIELIAENDFEREALARLQAYRNVRLIPGKTSDQGWPPDPRRTNVILQFPNPAEWGT